MINRNTAQHEGQCIIHLQSLMGKRWRILGVSTPLELCLPPLSLDMFTRMQIYHERVLEILVHTIRVNITIINRRCSEDCIFGRDCCGVRTLCLGPVVWYSGYYTHTDLKPNSWMYNQP